jgi:hypothetical protein
MHRAGVSVSKTDTGGLTNHSSRPNHRTLNNGTLTHSNVLDCHAVMDVLHDDGWLCEHCNRWDGERLNGNRGGERLHRNAAMSLDHDGRGEGTHGCDITSVGMAGNEQSEHTNENCEIAFHGFSTPWVGEQKCFS